MGMNFYARHIPTEAEHLEMLKTLNEKKYEDLKELVTKYTTRWHIGKRSCGWQFLFSPHHNFKEPWLEDYPWEDKLDSIKNFLNRDDIVIEDEEGRTFTPEQFWNEEVGESLYNNPEKYINGEQYDEKHPPKYQIFSLHTSNFEYTTDEGIRFSTTSEFS